MEEIKLLTLLPTVLFVVVGVGAYGWLKILKETNSLLREQNVELKCAHAALLDKYQENLQLLASLQGQVDTLRSIPLQSIDATLRSLAEVNTLILETLKKSALQLAIDTGAAALAVEQVQTHLDEYQRKITNGGVDR